MFFFAEGFLVFLVGPLFWWYSFKAFLLKGFYFLQGCVAILVVPFLRFL